MAQQSAKREDILESLDKLKLTGMKAIYDEALDYGIKVNMTFPGFLQALLKEEIKVRKLKSIQTRLRFAQFPETKDLDTFIFKDTPISSEHMLHLYGGEFIKAARNVVFVGGTGTGKTHLAISIGMKAVRDGRRVRFFNLVDLANLLEKEKMDGHSGKVARHLEKLDLLILDELGYLPFSKNGGQLVFHLLSKIHQKVSLMITTNLTFSEWVSIFADKKMTTALLDRICHQCDIVETGNESYRLKKRNQP